MSKTLRHLVEIEYACPESVGRSAPAVRPYIFFTPMSLIENIICDAEATAARSLTSLYSLFIFVLKL
ncbi:MAG: hypothetical protein SAK29_32870 [Scytonema sp. PMC 1069.18]|nr:hypothetical protein [Scytonema sp. PMC 1069.18]